MERQYIAIDLKSFFASVECVARDLDPLDTNLVVADESRTAKTICLAVTPSLKTVGVTGRPRLFQLIQKVKEENIRRKEKNENRPFAGSSFSRKELETHRELALTYITAPPRMAEYLKYSTKIYDIYLKYIAPEDIHVYSIDEVLIDATAYLNTYGMTARELAMTMIRDVLKETGITATAGIGSNLYLCKVAMDIVAKKMKPDENGVRIAELDEQSYRRELWAHEPLTDFWRVGKGYAKKLNEQGLYTMGDIARCSLGSDGDYYSEELLYRLFGVNAELLIDHAWGYEPVGMKEIREYQPRNSSIGSGQVLPCPYTFEKAGLLVKEMTDLLVLDLVDKRLLSSQMVLTVGYDVENLKNPEIRRNYRGEISIDEYGRKVPKHAHGTVNLEYPTSSTKIIMEAVTGLYDKIVNPGLLVRRIYLTASKVMPEEDYVEKPRFEQLNLFTDYEKREEERRQEKEERQKEKNMQQAVLEIQKRYGKNALVKGMNLEEGATTVKRNQQIGGHQA